MRCVRCGRELIDGVKECGFCGLKFGGDEKPAQGDIQEEPQSDLQSGGTVRQNEVPQYGSQSPQQMQSQPGYQGQQYMQPQPGYQGWQYMQSQPGYQGQQQMQSQPGYQGQQYMQSQPGYQGQQQIQSQPGYQGQQQMQSQPGYQDQQYMQPQPGYQDQEYGQPQTMQFAGYENRYQDASQVKKGSTYIPNVLNILGMIMAVISLFLPYAQLSGETRSISSVFDIPVAVIIVGVVVVLADVICAFVNHTACRIVSFVISLAVGGLFIFELVLAIVDMGKLEATADAGLMFGAWLSAAAAVILIASVPVWKAVTGRRAREDKS